MENFTAIPSAKNKIPPPINSEAETVLQSDPIVKDIVFYDPNIIRADKKKFPPTL
jgi:hypothetical protein